jgi:hypothetical protein
MVVVVALGNTTVSFSEGKSAADKSFPAKEQKSEVASADQPKMVIDPAEHDAGEVFEGTLVKHDFLVKNKGKADLLIEKVNPG